MPTDTLSRKEIAEQSFDSCIQTVKSYGGNVAEAHRHALVKLMQGMKELALQAIGRERTDG